MQFHIGIVSNILNCFPKDDVSLKIIQKHLLAVGFEPTNPLRVAGLKPAAIDHSAMLTYNIKVWNYLKKPKIFKLETYD